MKRETVMAIMRAALAAADPWALVREQLSLEPDAIGIAGYDLDPIFYQNIYVLGAGKAGAPMAAAVEDALNERVTGGLVIVKDGYRTVGTSSIEVIEAAHPVPDERGAEGAKRLLELAGRATERDIVICLISGGGSALLTLPAGNLTLEDIRLTTSALLLSGAPIEEVNAVRKHLTLASGGRLAEAAAPALLITLIISDVIGDELSVIASGPTFPDPTTYSNALTVLELRGLMDQVPAAVLEHLQAGAAGGIPETPKPEGNGLAGNGNHVILGSNRTALDAAVATASMLGYQVTTLDDPLIGEARDAAPEVLEFAWERARKRSAPPQCILAGGETTVTVTGTGSGGRAQEFVLSAALSIEGLADTHVFAFGTDGTDGPTDAAGAMADGKTASRARAKGLDPERSLSDNDSHTFFESLGDLIVTGPTGTNVNDIYGVIIEKSR